MHSSRMRTARSLPYGGGLCLGGVSVHGGSLTGWGVSVQGVYVQGVLCLERRSVSRGISVRKTLQKEHGPEIETPLQKEHRSHTETLSPSPVDRIIDISMGKYYLASKLVCGR